MVLPPRFSALHEQPPQQPPPRLSKHNHTYNHNPSLLRGVLHGQQNKATLPPLLQVRIPIQTSNYSSRHNPRRENQHHYRGASSSTSGSGSASSSTTTSTTTITACSRTSSTLTLEDNEIKKIFSSSSASSSTEPPTTWTIKDIPPQIKANELSRPTLSQDLLAGINWNLSDLTKRNIWSTQLHAPSPAWYHTFHYGVRAQTPASLNHFAVSLVQQGHDTTWDEDSVIELARFFVYRAAQRAGCTNEVDSLAAFAERVYRAFEGMPWQGLHTFFAQSLGESLLRTFVACWHVDKDNKGAITIQKNHTAQYVAYVSSALALSKFIGELYSHGFLPRTQTIGCVRVLLKNVKSIEHVQAIHAIISYAGIRLWRGSEEVKEFIKFLFGCTVGVKDNASVMGKEYPPKELERWVREVVALVQGFQAALKDS